MPLTDTLVVAHQMGHTYSQGPTAVVAVHGITCTVHRADRIAITGPSGSGKSTLLFLLAGLEWPTSGSIDWPEFGGSPVGHPRRAGMVYQGLSLIPALSVVENVGLPLVLAGTPDDEAQATAVTALATLGITSLAEKLPEELSGGQSQRVAIARVLAAGPALILADEPTGQLDHETGEQVVQALLDAADSTGAALVITTHDLSVAHRLDTEWRLVDGALAEPRPTYSNGARR
jgi:putative ABC transport system ATP-binding protein